MLLTVCMVGWMMLSTGGVVVHAFSAEGVATDASLAEKTAAEWASARWNVVTLQDLKDAVPLEPVEKYKELKKGAKEAVASEDYEKAFSLYAEIVDLFGSSGASFVKKYGVKKARKKYKSALKNAAVLAFFAGKESEAEKYLAWYLSLRAKWKFNLPREMKRLFRRVTRRLEELDPVRVEIRVPVDATVLVDFIPLKGKEGGYVFPGPHVITVMAPYHHPYSETSEISEDTVIPVELRRAGDRQRVKACSSLLVEGDLSGECSAFLKEKEASKALLLLVSRQGSAIAVKAALVDVATGKMEMKSGTIMAWEQLPGLLDALVAPAPPPKATPQAAAGKKGAPSPRGTPLWRRRWVWMAAAAVVVSVGVGSATYLILEEGSQPSKPPIGGRFILR